MIASFRHIVVPNSHFLENNVVNWTLSDELVRAKLAVGVIYGSDTELVDRLIDQALRENERVLRTPDPVILFAEFGDNSLNFEVRVFVSETTNTARSRILHDLHMAIDQACRERDITIAFPQRDLHFKTAETVLRVAIEKDEGDGK